MSYAFAQLRSSCGRRPTSSVVSVVARTPFEGLSPARPGSAPRTALQYDLITCTRLAVKLLAVLMAPSAWQAATLRTLAEGGALHLLPDLAASPGGPPAYICAASAPSAAAYGGAVTAAASPPAEVWDRYLLVPDSARKLPRRVDAAKDHPL